MPERYIDYLRSLDPELSKRSDRDIIEAYARGRGVSLEEAAAYLDRPIEGPGLVSGLKSGGAALIGGLGALAGAAVGGFAAEVARRKMEAAGTPQKEIERQRQAILQDYLDNPATRFAEEVQFFNRGPASLGEVAEDPLGALGYATGQAVTLLGPAAAGRAAALAGRSVASAVGGTAGRAAQAAGRAAELVGASRGAQAVTFSAPSAYDIASQQLEKGEVRPLDLLAGAAVSGAIERLTGPERLFFGAPGSLGKTPVRTVTKNLLRGAAEEAMQEPVQTTIESVAGSRELPSGEELALSSVLGAMGGGVLGGALSIPRALDQAQEPSSPVRNWQAGDPAVRQALEQQEAERRQAPPVQYGQVQPEPMTVPPEVEQALSRPGRDVIDFRGILARTYYPSETGVYQPSPVVHVAALGEQAVPQQPVEEFFQPSPAVIARALQQAQQATPPVVQEPSSSAARQPSGSPQEVSPVASNYVSMSQAVAQPSVTAQNLFAAASEVEQTTPKVVEALERVAKLSEQVERKRADRVKEANTFLTNKKEKAPVRYVFPLYVEAYREEVGEGRKVTSRPLRKVVRSLGLSEDSTVGDLVRRMAEHLNDENVYRQAQLLERVLARYGVVGPIEFARRNRVGTVDIRYDTPIRDFIPLYIEARRKRLRSGNKNTDKYLRNVLRKLNLSEDATVGELIEAMAANIEDEAVDRQAQFVEEALKERGLVGPIEFAERGGPAGGDRVNVLIRAAKGDTSINDDLIANVTRPQDTETFSEYFENVVMPFLTAMRYRRRTGSKGRKPAPVAGARELAALREVIRKFEQGEGYKEAAKALGMNYNTLYQYAHNALKKIDTALKQAPERVGKPLRETFKAVFEQAADRSRMSIPMRSVEEVRGEPLTETPTEDTVGKEEVAEGGALTARERAMTAGSGLGTSARPTTVANKKQADEGEEASIRAARKVEEAAKAAQAAFEGRPDLAEQYEQKREAFGLPPFDEIPEGLAKSSFLLRVAEYGEVTDDALQLLKGLLDSGLIQFSDRFGRRFGSTGGPKASPERIHQVIYDLFPNYSKDDHSSVIRVYKDLDELKEDLGENSPVYEHFSTRKTAIAGVVPVVPSPRKDSPRQFTNTFSSALVVIADRVPDDERFIRALIMHEIGAHLGLQRILGPNNLRAFAREIEVWAKKGDVAGSTAAIGLGSEAIKRARASLNITLRNAGITEIVDVYDVSEAIQERRKEVKRTLGLVEKSLREGRFVEQAEKEKAKLLAQLKVLDSAEFIYYAEVLAYSASVLAEVGAYDNAQYAYANYTYVSTLLEKLIRLVARLVRKVFGLELDTPRMNLDDLAGILYGAAYNFLDKSWLFDGAPVRAWNIERDRAEKAYRLVIDVPALYRKDTLPSDESAQLSLLLADALGGFIPYYSGGMPMPDFAADVLDRGHGFAGAVDRHLKDRLVVHRNTIVLSEDTVLDLSRPFDEQPDRAKELIKQLAEMADKSVDSFMEDPLEGIWDAGPSYTFDLIRREGFSVVIGFHVEEQRELRERYGRIFPYRHTVAPVWGWVVDLPKAVLSAKSVEYKDEPYAPDVPNTREAAFRRFSSEIARILDENPSLSYDEAVIRTESFRKWYGLGTMDEGPMLQGRPVVFYHSTTAVGAFPAFVERKSDDLWFHFGSQSAALARYLHVTSSSETVGFTIPVYLALRVPVVGADLGHFREGIFKYPETLMQMVLEFARKQGADDAADNIEKALQDAAGLYATLEGESDRYDLAVNYLREYADYVARSIADNEPFIENAKEHTVRMLRQFLDMVLDDVYFADKADRGEKISLRSIYVNYGVFESEFHEKAYDLFARMADGYLYENTVEGGGVSVAVFDPANIKSINAVAFSPETDDFLFMDVFDTPKDGIVKSVLAGTPEPVRKWGRAVTDAARNMVKKGIYAAAFTHDLINMVKDVLPSAARLEAIRQRQEIERRGLVGRAELIMQDFVNLDEKEQDAVQKFIYDATMEQKWFMKPVWRGDAAKDIEVDEDLAERYEQFSDRAKDVIRRVFEYGDEIWHAKFTAIMADVDAQEREQIEDAEAAIREEYTPKINDAKDTDERQKLIREMENAIKTRINEIREEAAEQRKRLREQLPARLPGPYAPLMRHGKYVVVGMSREMAEAIDSGKKGKRVSEMMADPDHYWVEFHDSFAKAKARQRELAKLFDEVDAFERARWERPVDQMPLNAYQRLLEAFTQVDDPKLRQKMRATLHDLYVASLADTASQKSKLRRQYVAGFDYRDIMTTFARRAESDARFISHVLYGREAAQAMQAMKREAMARKSPVQGKRASREERLRVYNELAARYAATMAHESSPLVNAGLSVSSFWMLLSSPAYYFQNLTQPVMMSMPYMIGKFKTNEVVDAFIQAYKDVAPFVKTVTKEWVADLNKIVNRSGGLYDENGIFKGDKDKLMLERMLDKGILDIGIDTEMGTLLDTHPALRPAARIHQKLVRLARRVEIINRTSTALAAFRLATKSGMDFEEAVAYTEDVLKTTHGDYSQHAAPRAFVNNVGRLVLQFRKFQLIQISMLAKLFNATFRGESPQVRAEARRALLATLSQALIFTGIKGLPGWAILGWLLRLLLEDEEPYNLDLKTYEALNGLFGKGFADMMINGVPSLLNMNLTSKIGWGNVFSLFPYTDIDLSSRDGLAKTLLAASGPLIGGLGANVAEGLGLMRMGAYYRGLELMLPRGLRDAMRAYRIASEGLATRRGEVLVPEDEINTLDTFLQLLGFPSHKVSKAYLRRSIMFEMEQHFRRLSAELRFRYVQAWREGDREAMKKIEARWREVNDARARYGFKRRPLKDLRSAVRESRRRERRTIGGVQYRSGSKRAAERLAATI